MSATRTGGAVVGRGRHTETEQLYELVVSAGELRAEVADSDGPTWRSDRWETLVPSSALAGEWEHYKGAVYTVCGEVTAGDAAPLVAYTSSDGRLWLRRASMWQEHVTAGSYSGPRFRRRDAPA